MDFSNDWFAKFGGIGISRNHHLQSDLQRLHRVAVALADVAVVVVALADVAVVDVVVYLSEVFPKTTGFWFWLAMMRSNHSKIRFP